MELERREALQKRLAEEAERKKKKKRKVKLWQVRASQYFQNWTARILNFRAWLILTREKMQALLGALFHV